MGRGDRKTQSKRRANMERKREAMPIPELASAPRADVQTHEDQHRLAVEVRARRAGLQTAERTEKRADGSEQTVTYFPRKSMREAASPLMSCPQGLAMRSVLSDEGAMQAWKTWAGWSDIVRRYRAYKIGKTGAPDSSRFEGDREAAQTEETASLDTRTWEEKFVDAANVWVKWEGYVMQLSRPQIDLLRLSLETDEGWTHGPDATPKGRALAHAAHDLSNIVADVVDGRR